jgi:hypothetical protein
MWWFAAFLLIGELLSLFTVSDTMKKASLLLSLLLLAGSFCPVAQAAPSTVATAQAKADPNEQYEYGYQDGRDAAAGYAATYGAGTPAYQAAMTAAIADSRYQARHSEGDLAAYFQGYTAGLSSY